MRGRVCCSDRQGVSQKHDCFPMKSTLGSPPAPTGTTPSPSADPSTAFMALFHSHRARRQKVPQCRACAKEIPGTVEIWPRSCGRSSPFGESHGRLAADPQHARPIVSTPVAGEGAGCALMRMSSRRVPAAASQLWRQRSGRMSAGTSRCSKCSSRPLGIEPRREATLLMNGRWRSLKTE
jgi:hypothetical protein